MMMLPIRKEKGVALITVLFAMALIVLLSAGMIYQQSLRVFKADHYLSQQQAYNIALGSEELARQMLLYDLEVDNQKDAAYDSLDERWAAYSVSLPLDSSGLVKAQVNDLNGRFNLNTLLKSNGEINGVAVERLDRLLSILELPDITTDAIIDWIDSNNEKVSFAGAEDLEYLSSEPSYRAANQALSEISEIRLIKGMTEEAYQSLRPHISVLPDAESDINVNTATVPVLMAIHPGVTEAKAKAMVELRAKSPFATVSDFLEASVLTDLRISRKGLSTRTKFFDIVSEIHYNNYSITSVTRLFRHFDEKMWVIHRDASQNNQITKAPYQFF